ncbi:hypothetical protein NQZ68_007846 [Dissostichus eleginoides]|nr:hypothetical protein NQZ68_007846 [Dissostichus eleginoides]
MVNYQKYITVMQLALGVTASNKEHCLPPRKHMCIHKNMTTIWYKLQVVFSLAAGATEQLWPSESEAAVLPEPQPAPLQGSLIHPQHPSPTAGSITGASSVSTIQGKPSLRRIKGRIHRSKSLDSLDLLDSNRLTTSMSFVFMACHSEATISPETESPAQGSWLSMAVCALEENLLTCPNSNAADGSNGPPYKRDGSRVLKAWRWKPDLSETHHKACGKRRRGRGSRARGVELVMCDACEGCVFDPTGCEEGVADVEYISGGSDSGALAAYVSSDETYGR